jgi:isoaspartyl peptidase/L-asparaginase-like protein (Ntn-hydrolase superfamily)
VRTPSLVARAVLETTDHHLLVGHGAQAFARNMGFKIEDDLNTEHSRKLWLEWKRRTDPSHYLDPAKRAEVWRREGLKMVREGLIREEHFYGTINCDAVNAKGEVCGVTTTSGLSWKIPGRVGDSPILGAGLYVDGAVGAAGSTGRGEANLYNLCSFLIVEEMRRGKSPKDAGMEALRRIKANTVEKRLLNRDGNPAFGINFYVLNARGDVCGVTTTSGLAWKIPGRVGDSPILGAGLYVDGEVGAAGSTGRGEANLFGLSSFLIVENMRRGMSPKDAGMEALKRVRAATIEKRLLNSRGEPRFYVKFYIVNRKGEFAGVGMYARQDGKDQTFSVCTEKGPETLNLDGLLGEAASE